MTLPELKQFLDDCIDKQIPFPRNTMQVVLDDFFEAVPEEHHGVEQLEFNHRKGDEFVRVFISPDRSKMVKEVREWADKELNKGVFEHPADLLAAVKAQVK